MDEQSQRHRTGREQKDRNLSRRGNKPLFPSLIASDLIFRKVTCADTLLLLQDSIREYCDLSSVRKAKGTCSETKASIAADVTQRHTHVLQER